MLALCAACILPVDRDEHFCALPSAGSIGVRTYRIKGPWKDPPWLPRAPPTRSSTARTASGRISFAKIREPLEVPDLLALQTDSFDWLLGNERWKARVAEAKAAGREDMHEKSGLEEIFEEISPIEDFSGSMRCRSATTGSSPPSTPSRSARSGT